MQCLGGTSKTDPEQQTLWLKLRCGDVAELTLRRNLNAVKGGRLVKIRRDGSTYHAYCSDATDKGFRQTCGLFNGDARRHAGELVTTGEDKRAPG